MSLAILPWTVRSTCGPVAVAEGCTAPATDSRWNSVDLNVHAVDCDRTFC